MRKILFVLFIIFHKGNSQNLVKNPSFEIYSNCPNSSEQIDRATFWNNPPNNTGSSDYFNTCSSINWCDVPNNSQGFQLAQDGNAYAGIVIYYDFYLAPDYREYIQTELQSPLLAGQTYQVSFYVSLSDTSRLASNNIGAVLTVNQLIGDGGELPITSTPQILNQNIVNDTNGWTLISGEYSAIGGEKFLTIGNFFYNNQTLTQVSNPIYGFLQAYYLVDNVSVTQTLGVENFNINNISVFPNPFSDILKINTPENEIVEKIEICSTTGTIKLLDINEKEYNLSEISSGFYFLNITFESGKKAHAKIIKK
jgi:hypothetical protein